MGRGAWWAAIRGVVKSQTWLSDFTFTFHFHALEKEMATHSSVLAWRIPGTGEPGGLLSMGSHRVRHDWNDLAAAAAALIGSVMAFVHEGIFLSTRLILLWWEYKEQQITFELRRFLPFPTFFTSRTHSTPKCVAFSQSGGSWFFLPATDPYFYRMCVPSGLYPLSLPIPCYLSVVTLTLTLKSLSCVQLFVTPWTIAYQAPPSM